MKNTPWKSPPYVKAELWIDVELLFFCTKTTFNGSVYT